MIQELYLDKNIIQDLQNIGEYVKLKKLNLIENITLSHSPQNLRHLFTLKFLEFLTIGVNDPKLSDYLSTQLPQLRSLDGKEVFQVSIHRSQS